MTRNRRWTRSRIVEAIREYHRRYGRPPRSIDWSVAAARWRWGEDSEKFREVKRRWDEGDWPHDRTVRDVFGTWNAALRAAGFAGRPTHAPPPDRREEFVRMWNDGVPVPEMARHFGVKEISVINRAYRLRRMGLWLAPRKSGPRPSRG